MLKDKKKKKKKKEIHSLVSELKTCAILIMEPLCFHTFFRDGKCHALMSRDQNMDSCLCHSADDLDLSNQ